MSHAQTAFATGDLECVSTTMQWRVQTMLIAELDDDGVGTAAAAATARRPDGDGLPAIGQLAGLDWHHKWVCV